MSGGADAPRPLLTTLKQAHDGVLTRVYTRRSLSLSLSLSLSALKRFTERGLEREAGVHGVSSFLVYSLLVDLLER